MRLKSVLVVGLVFYLMFPENILGLWWAVGSSLLLDKNSICRKTKCLAGKQRRICRKEPQIVREVIDGAKVAIRECQVQFANRRWNCTAHRRSIGKILKRDTRESAFLFAISAAGVLKSVTEACSMGELPLCSCVHHRDTKTAKGKFVWSGCNDDVQYGYTKSKDFMDARPKKRRGDIRTLIQLHNNEAGRRAVINNMTSKCKCHGLSGSCSLKTCWRTLPHFSAIGNDLKNRFDGAFKVIISNDGDTLISAGDSKPYRKIDLIYTEDSSTNFCKASKRHGSLGTSGRLCDPHSMGVEGCGILCCGRGYRTYQMTEEENCQCRFVWCCEVICKKCMVTKTIHRCV
ncbi:protein Wnt-6-like isoform X2 [Tubulanus polymorphus]|uniref:protein Wnt-6-like isoform X2 n=1 Tax=Tubulanus polymorphus TaxID=672921 RepID=UPI003DA2CC64